MNAQINFMNFNDKLYSQDPFTDQIQEDQFDQDLLIESDNRNNKLHIKSKSTRDSLMKKSYVKGKQNEPINEILASHKNGATNHSFNIFFSQISQKNKKKVDFINNKKIDLNDIIHGNLHTNISLNPNASSKINNFRLNSDQLNNLNDSETIHEEVKQFVKKYFPQNHQSSNFNGQYFSIEDFLEILWQQFQSLIGKKNSFDLIEHFSDKVYLIFGDKIYFHQLFEKTKQSGLTGLIFQIVKAINQDEKQISQQKENKLSLKKSQILKPKSLLTSKNSTCPNGQSGRNFHSRLTNKGIDNALQSSSFNRSNTSKISLQKFFGNSVSRIKYSENFKHHFNEDSKTLTHDLSGFPQQNVQEIKRILQNYIQQMYNEAQQKLTKKYTVQMRKITLKYKQTEKLLEKINQKISNHYDTIQLQKHHQKKLKQMVTNQNQLHSQIKLIQQQAKFHKSQSEKYKINSFNLDKELIKLKQKLEKYQNAFFEKAMQKSSNIHPINSVPKQRTNFQNSIYFPQPLLPQIKDKQKQIPRIEFKHDTFGENKLNIYPMTPSNTPSYIPYVSRQSNSALTPTKVQKMQTNSVSPLKQRISFIKTVNPINPINQFPNSVVQNANQKLSLLEKNNSRIISSTITTIEGKDGVKIGRNQVEMGDKIQLRSLSPIGKLGQSNLNGPNQQISTGSRLQINTIVTGYANGLSQRSISPLKVQFCTSQVGGNIQNR